MKNGELCVPFIVVDARVMTASIIEEIQHISTSSNHLRKTYFVINDDGTGPALDAVRPFCPGGRMKTSAPAEIVDNLSRAGLRNTSPPDDIPGFADRNFARHTKMIGRQMQNVGAIGAQL